MAGSGHIAGVVNPPSKPKYQFWTDGPPRGQVRRLGREGQGDAWLMVARLARLADGAGAGESPRPQAGRGKLKPLGDAPGEYVRVKA